MLSLFAHFMERARAAKGSAAGESFVAITDEGTPLQDMAREHRFRRVFTNPSDIGGRYSALSYFGLVPAALIGADVSKLLDRGLTMAEAGAPCVAASEAPGLWLGAVLGELALADREAGDVSDEFRHWVEEQLAERARARENRDYARADAIRDELASSGVEIEDTPAGSRWKLVP